MPSVGVIVYAISGHTDILSKIRTYNTKGQVVYDVDVRPKCSYYDLPDGRFALADSVVGSENQGIDLYLGVSGKLIKHCPYPSGVSMDEIQYVVETSDHHLLYWYSYKMSGDVHPHLSYLLCE